jgi:molybdopterin molybdotransferase
MISVTEAKEIIQQRVKSLHPVYLPLKDAAGLTLAADVTAITNIPNFRQSSMDGYAIKYAAGNSTFQLRGEMAAGATMQVEISANEAARIFTGAPLPTGADTVVMQERVEVADGHILINDPKISQHQHVREKGAEVKEGDIAMLAGAILSPAAIGFLAGIGITKVAVFPAPVVTIIVTGNELQEPGRPLKFGQVYESNSVMLQSALHQIGIKEINILRAFDDLKSLEAILTNALSSSDVILLTGGVSVGDYDFVVEAATNAGVKQGFHKIKQKPGKPLYFGTKDQKIIFGLPGNPSSVLSCFYQYVLPGIGTMMKKDLSLKTVEGTLTHDYSKGAGLTHFLKGSYAKGSVTPLHAQESFRLHAFAQADCLIVLQEDHEDYLAGDRVEVQLIPLL